MSTPAGAVVSGSLPPHGKAVAVEGGFRVSGRWTWASGIHQAAWAFCGCRIFDDDQPRLQQGGIPALTYALLPVDQVNILDTWFVGGMRGTGSTDFAVDDVFVPDAMTLAIFQSPPYHPAPLFRMGPLLFGPPFAMIGLGIARRVIEGLIDLAATKNPARGGWSSLSQRTSAQYVVARAKANVESARGYVVEAFRECWDLVADGQRPEGETRARLRRAQVHAGEVAVDAVDAIYRAAGGDALAESGPFERSLRDVHAIQAHVMLHREVMEQAGRVAFGLEPTYPAF
jgi:alkylation response protein AidB-like acyl-CoA dehydrogenase